MAVPSTGSLSMQDIAQERLYSTYGSGSITGPISMYNLINGGNTGGAVNSGNNYPALNTGCDPNPAATGYTQILNVYKYDHVTDSSTGPFTYYLDSSEAATPQDMADGDIMYSDADLTTPLSPYGIGNQSYYYQNISYGDNNVCTEAEGGFGAWDITTGGAIANFICAIP